MGRDNRGRYHSGRRTHNTNIFVSDKTAATNPRRYCERLGIYQDRQKPQTLRSDLSHELRVVEHAGDVRGPSHQLLHLRVACEHLSHQVRVGHHVLHHRVAHHLRQHLRVGHQLGLHLLLHLHEAGGTHAQTQQAGHVLKST